MTRFFPFTARKANIWGGVPWKWIWVEEKKKEKYRFIGEENDREREWKERMSWNEQMYGLVGEIIGNGEAYYKIGDTLNELGAICLDSN